MSNQINDLLIKGNPELSDLSVKNYTQSIMKVLEILNANNIFVLINKPESVILKLKRHYDKFHSIKTRLAAIVVLLKNLSPDSKKVKNDNLTNALEVYRDEIENLTDQIKKNLSTHEKTDKEKENWINKEEIEQIKQNLKKDLPPRCNTIYDLNKYRDYIMFLLYDDIPTRADFTDSKIIYKTDKPLNDEYNYIILDRKNKKAEYHLNQYKTNKTYGSKVIKINDDLFEPLLDYKKRLLHFNKDEWLFLNDSNTKLSRNRLSAIYSNLGKSINKKLSITQNRHIHVSNLIPIEAMKELSDKMGHTVNEAVSTYAKT